MEKYVVEDRRKVGLVLAVLLLLLRSNLSCLQEGDCKDSPGDPASSRISPAS